MILLEAYLRLFSSQMDGNTSPRSRGGRRPKIWYRKKKNSAECISGLKFTSFVYVCCSYISPETRKLISVSQWTQWQLDSCRARNCCCRHASHRDVYIIKTDHMCAFLYNQALWVTRNINFHILDDKDNK